MKKVDSTTSCFPFGTFAIEISLSTQGLKKSRHRAGKFEDAKEEKDDRIRRRKGEGS